MSTEPTNSDYAQLKSASAALHFWYGQRREHTEALTKAEYGIAHADEQIAEVTAKIREALVALGITDGRANR